jgi:nitrate/nitrite transport system substrate-binding protein
MMKQKLRIGFLPLTDCAVLVAALERGFFEKYSLHVTLQREVSWANIRDRVAFGELDAAHMLAPMPLAATLGIDGLGIPMQAAFSLGLNGSAITLASNLMDDMQVLFPQHLQTSSLRATGLKALLASQPGRKLVFASVYPFSQHHYLLRAWLQEGGLDLERDVEIQVIPPPQMVNSLAEGKIDGYCAGEPWNQLAVQRGIGHVAVSSYELWNNGPEKVLGVTQAWAEANPETHVNLLCALLEAAQWLENHHNRARIAELLARPEYLDMPVEVIRPPLLGHYRYAPREPERFLPDFNVFARYAANFPWHSHGAYFLAQMQAAGQLPSTLADEAEILARVYRTDIYRLAADILSLPYPLGNDLPSSGNIAPWVLREASQPIAMGSTYAVLHHNRAE